MARAVCLCSRIYLLSRHTRFSTYAGDIPNENILDYLYNMSSGLDDDGLRDQAIDQFIYFPHPVSVATGNIMHIAKQGPEVFLRMYQEYLKAGLKPNAYTYTVVIKELAKFKKTAEAGKYMAEMVEKGMRPNAATCVAVFEELVRKGQAKEGDQLLTEMRKKGVMPEEKVVRKVLKDRTGPVVECVLNLLFGK